MKRTVIVGRRPPGKDPKNPGKVIPGKPISREFYYDTYYSSIILGENISGGTFFAKSEASSERNYEGENNPSASGSMRLMGIYAKLIGPNNGPISIDVTQTNVIEEITALINSGTITVKVAEDIVHKDVLGNLLPDLSAMIIKGLDDTGTTGENEGRFLSAVIPAHTQSAWMKRSNQLLIPFEKPLPIHTGENLRIEWASKGYAGTALLNGYKFRMFACSEVHTTATRVARG